MTNTYTRKHNIMLVILLIGTLNIYNIVKYGITANILPNYEGIMHSAGIEAEGERIGIMVIILGSLMALINITPKPQDNPNHPQSLALAATNPYQPQHIVQGEGGRKQEEGLRGKGGVLGIRKEQEVLIGTSIIGIISVIYSKELIVLYLGLELYNYSTYLLLLKKETIETRRISIVYLIISSIVSGGILLTFLYIYRQTGTLNYEYLGLYEKIDTAIAILIIGLIIKIGVMPFTAWLIRLYKSIDRLILIYQLVIPKVLILFLIYKFLHVYENVYVYESSSYIMLVIILLGLLSIIGGSIGGLYQKEISLLLAYSSILNIGYVLVGIGINGKASSWVIYNYMVVYILTLIGVFSILFLYDRTNKVNLLTLLYKQPYLYGCLLVLILSFIGVPPLGGFYGKLYILLTYLHSTSFTIKLLAITGIILGSIISTLIYLKFILPSAYLTSNTIHDNEISSLKPITSSYILASIVLLIITYSFYLPLYYPFLLSLGSL